MPSAKSHLAGADMVTWLRAQTERRLDAVAYTFLLDGEAREAPLTYNELDRQARAVAARLADRMQPGDRAILVYPSGLEFIIAFWGCLYAGIIAVPVPEPLQPRHLHRLQNIVADAGTRWILTSSPLLTTLRQRFGDLGDLEWMGTDAIESGWADAWRDPGLSDDHVAFVQYTSGSTGAPKGAVVRHRNLVANCRMIAQLFEADEHSVLVSWLPLFHDMGLIIKVIETAFLGAHCILLSPFAFIQKPARWLQVISRYGGQISGAPDFAFALTARKMTPDQRHGLDLRTWRYAFSAAEPVRPSTLRRFAETFEPYGLRWESLGAAYGLAEATVFVSGGPAGRGPGLCELDAHAFARHRLTAPRTGLPTVTSVACGRTDYENQQVSIVNPDSLRPCAPDEIGEIWVSGPHVAGQYWSRPEETAATFGAHLAETGEGPFLRTGDLGFLRDGQLYVAGRIKDLIIIDGSNHHPHDIELTVENAHSAVRKGCTAAFSIDHDERERLVVVAEINAADGAAPDEDALARRIRHAISAEHGLRLEDIVFIPPRSIDKTSSGKIARRSCRDRYLNGGFTRLHS